MPVIASPSKPFDFHVPSPTSYTTLNICRGYEIRGRSGENRSLFGDDHRHSLENSSHNVFGLPLSQAVHKLRCNPRNLGWLDRLDAGQARTLDATLKN